MTPHKIIGRMISIILYFNGIGEKNIDLYKEEENLFLQKPPKKNIPVRNPERKNIERIRVTEYFIFAKASMNKVETGY